MAFDPSADRVWTVVAPVYDRAVALVGWHRWQRAVLSDATAGSVLDVGCGPAHLGPELLERGMTYVGVDRNAAMLDRARRRLGSSPDTGLIVRADITALPFAARSFDIVVATGVLGLLDVAARRMALAEMARVAGSTIRLLEPVHRPGAHLRAARSRVIALVRESPIELAELAKVGFRAEVRGPPLLAGVYSAIDATRM